MKPPTKAVGNTAQMRLRIASSQALHPSFCPFGAKAQSRRYSSLPHQTHFVGLWWGPRDLFRQKYAQKTLKYTKYSCGFTPFSDAKSLVRLSCRFVRYYLFLILRDGKAAVKKNTCCPGVSSRYWNYALRIREGLRGHRQDRQSRRDHRHRGHRDRRQGRRRIRRSQPR